MASASALVGNEFDWSVFYILVNERLRKVSSRDSAYKDIVYILKMNIVISRCNLRSMHVEPRWIRLPLKETISIEFPNSSPYSKPNSFATR